MSQNVESMYLVRGAMLQCDKGSHPRRLNLPKCHGVYVLNHPQARVDDKKECNISYFGICVSQSPPEGAEEVLLDGYVQEGKTEQVPQVQGLKCKPDILGEWRGVNRRSLISGEFSAITTESYLVCACGGIIRPVSSGQEYED